MSTTYKTLYQKVLLRLNSEDGRALLAAKEGVNDAQKVIVRIEDFDELKVLDTSGTPVTVASTKTYHLVDDWSLTRPKDIISLRYMDGTSSRKLEYIAPRRLDKFLPYPEQSGDQRPVGYTRRGLNLELIPVPEEAKSIYVYYTQWPLVLTADADEMQLPDDVEDVVVGLATEIANAIVEGVTETNWTPRARAMLAGAVTEEAYKPDHEYIARPFNPRAEPIGEYWKDPFIKRSP